MYLEFDPQMSFLGLFVRLVCQSIAGKSLALFLKTTRRLDDSFLTSRRLDDSTTREECSRAKTQFFKAYPFFTQNVSTSMSEIFLHHFQIDLFWFKPGTLMSNRSNSVRYCFLPKNYFHNQRHMIFPSLLHFYVSFPFDFTFLYVA